MNGVLLEPFVRTKHDVTLVRLTILAFSGGREKERSD